MVEIILRQTASNGSAHEKVLYSFCEMNSSLPDQETMIFPDLEIRLKERIVVCRGNPITLGYYEFFTLCLLAEHPGWIYSKEQIYEAVWKEPGEEGGNAVPNVISQLRHKLWPDNPKGGYIRTVQNSGYKFEL